MDGAAKPPNLERALMKCPHCNQEIEISTADLADHAYILRALCKKCGKEFLIVEGVPMTEKQYSDTLGKRRVT